MLGLAALLRSEVTITAGIIEAMTATPFRLKMVKFDLPHNPSLRASTAPVKSSRYSHPGTRSPFTSSPSANLNTVGPTVTRGAKPDLIADIVDRPKTAPTKSPRSISSPLKICTPVVSAKAGSSGLSAVPTEKGDVEKAKFLSITSPASFTQKSGFDERPVQHAEKQPVVISRSSCKRKVISGSQFVHNNMARHAREHSNMATHNYTRMMKYDVAKLREQLVKLEEEIKHALRSRNVLEVGVQEMRRSLSVNQQSLSMHQKRAKRGAEVGGIKAVVEKYSQWWILYTKMLLYLSLRHVVFFFYFFYFFFLLLYIIIRIGSQCIVK